jgi:hypothetical protein
MDDEKLIIGTFLIAVTIAYLAVDKSQRDRLVNQIGIRGRKLPSTFTPTRAVFPEKQSRNNPLYNDSFPPLRREALSEIASPLFVGKGGVMSNLDLGEKDIMESLLPMTADYKACTAVKFTPTGFSTSEIKAMGDFPDYATLSGVPLPEPYLEFDIDKALPRPYRPFRWNYHQTMCMSTWDPLIIVKIGIH